VVATSALFDYLKPTDYFMYDQVSELQISVLLGVLNGCHNIQRLFANVIFIVWCL
jgi:hypothetical protein